MRLTCPNCDAQYEVDDRAIPDSGRDVQCSNCGHAWFQLPPNIEESLEDEAATLGAPVMTQHAVAEAAPASIVAPAEVPAPPMPEADAPPPPPADEQTAPEVTEEPRRRALDEKVQAVLREEAEREKRARMSEGSLETQPDLGLSAPAGVVAPSPPPEPDPESQQSYIDRIRAFDPSVDDDKAQPDQSGRRELLPDIEEINSTLRASSERSRNVATAPHPLSSPDERRRGFRLGFRSVVLVVLVLLVIYLLAPLIAARVPALSRVLNGYVVMVDALRNWLNGLMSAAAAKVQGKG
ncbi:MAG: zinc-ribbon domain-containing protein [Paracoccaceae bacterium]|nr:zinc-ribbon domain-containing protein [Paracoccaceae bacterium]